jgi:hypothetical protein
MFGRCLRFSLVVLPLLLPNTTAFAHDNWISRGLHRNSAGEWCCGEGDCFVVPSNQVSMNATGYSLYGTEMVPFSEAQPAVPMLKDNEVIGIISIFRQEIRPFTDRQVTLLANFAAQAVIAIENTRLLNELRQRTDDLSESLEQQTATSEVLRVISTSPGELEPVFQAILENATRLCEGNFAALWQYDGEALVGAAQYNVTAGFAELCRSTKLQLGPQGAVRKAALERRVLRSRIARIRPSAKTRLRASVGLASSNALYWS